MLLAHNEDGHRAYLGRMFVVRVRPPSGIRFVCLVYPGTLPGNGPGLNERGVAQTTNYIAPRTVPDGVPRYFLGRAVLEAESLDRAVAIATGDDRAFPWHHNLASLPDRRLVSLETWPGRHSRVDVRGLHLHTNHLLHESMQDVPEDRDYIERSSGPRLAALRRFARTHELRAPDDLLDALSDRSSRPCRVCRHPGDEVRGVTLASALFEAPRVEIRLAEGPTCLRAIEFVRPRPKTSAIAPDVL
jgi:hypothetical protein